MSLTSLKQNMSSRLRYLVGIVWFFATLTAAATTCDKGELSAGLYFDSGDISIHYESVGNGPAVVLIHGLATTAQENWQRVVPLLSQEFRVISLDQRGHGRSQKPCTPDRYGRLMVADILNLMNHLDVDQAHIVGYSMGGLIAMRLAIDYPQRLLSLTVAGQGWASASEMQAVASVAAALRSANSALVLVPDPSELRENVRDQFMKTLAANDPLALAALLDSYEQLTIGAEEISATSIPLHIIVGSDDTLVHRAIALKELRPDAKLLIVPGETHLSTPISDDFAPAINEFLRSATK